MASYDPTLLNIDPYYDDYDEDKKFLRVLFRPGYAVQARELTQLQSILQNQVSRMGDHIFEDGAKIIGGDQSVQNCSYIRVVKGASLDMIGGYDISQIKTDGGTTENVSARVVHYERTPSSTVDDYDLLYVNFLQGNTFQPEARSDQPLLVELEQVKLQQFLATPPMQPWLTVYREDVKLSQPVPVFSILMGSL